ncbi:D-beta-hydroxybutyrate dehydrogenase-like [Liolophura sinensis]|uniref:D-beta-hydroxybutyrate dehydrogenase-like n=1 Tax=Liolophura sinensis TaxID=3198878 RepID=UPI0031598C65
MKYVSRLRFCNRLMQVCLKWSSCSRRDPTLVGGSGCGFYLPSRRFSDESASACRDLSGKTALVTGSTSGIGLGVAETLAERGCDVIVNGLGDRHQIQAIQDNINRKHGVRCHFVDADLSLESEVTRMCNEVAREFPNGVDVLVNNAGLQHVCPVEDFPVEKWNLLVAVMLSAPFHLIRSFLPGMKTKGWGRIINVASVHGLVASPQKSAYCAAKHGVVGLTKAVGLETITAEICVVVAQGQIRTVSERDNVSFPDAKLRLLETFQPTKEFVDVSQIADLIHFLCTRSADQITGSAFTIDGGWTAR